MTLTTVAAEDLAEEIAKCNHSPICSVCRERLAELTDRAALRDEAFDVVVRADRVAELEARLAETQAAYTETVNAHAAEILRVQQMHYAAEEQHVATVKAESDAWKARLAETQKALERIVAAADADGALNLRDVAFIARAALTTHPADE